MKRTILFLSGLALLMAGCNKVETVETPAEETTMESPGNLTIDIKVNEDDNTRSVKTGWKAGDKVYVFFDHFFLDYLTDPEIGKSRFSNDVQYLTLTFNGISWKSEFSDEALEKYLLSQSSGSLIAVYYSDIVPEFRCIHGLRNNREQFYIEVKNGSNHPGFYLYDKSVSYTVANRKLTASLNMHPYERAVHFFIPGVKYGDSSHSLTSDQVGINSLYAIYSENLNEEGFKDAVIDLNTSSGYSVWAKYSEEGIDFYGRLLNSVELGQECDYVLKVRDPRTSSSSNDDVICTFTKTATLYGKEAIELPTLSDARWMKEFAYPITQRGFTNNHEWVMMADGLRWSALNVGATEQKEPGDLMLWPAAKDEAKAWGENWNMPTKEQWEGLLNNSSHEITPVYETVNGQQVFSGVQILALDDGDCGYYVTGNKLFLPAAGYKTYMQFGLPNGYYWTYTAFWQGSDVVANYVLLTPETPYFSTANTMKAMGDDLSGRLLARPVLKYY